MEGTESLRSILDLERQKGYTDRAVIGGLDGYLLKHSEQIRKMTGDPQLLREFDGLRLADSPYGSLSTEERKRWISLFTGWLDRAERPQEAAVVSEQDHGNPSPTASVEKKNRGKAPRRRVSQEAGLDSPITVIRGITPTVAGRFARLNVRTIRDLLGLFPRRYVDYSQTKPIAQLLEGEEQTVIGTVWQAKVATLGSRRGTEATIGDETGTIRAVWFNQPYLAKTFRTNAKIVLSGPVSVFRGSKVFESPEWELLKDTELIHTGRLVPIYPLTRGLYPRQVRKWTKEAVDGFAPQMEEFLPSEIRARCRLPGLPEAITQIHFPEDRSTAGRARSRLAFDELLLLQLGVLARKRDWKEGQPGNPLRVDREVVTAFLNCLPFALTTAQQRVLKEVLSDVRQPQAMSRLLQGEVGSGKTVIAVLAVLIAATNGYQGAVMAPTEILAEQHFTNICGYLSQVGNEELQDKPGAGTVKRYTGFLSGALTVALLIGSLSKSDKAELQKRIAQGEIDIVIGTHALIQKEVDFSRLGLVVIDEQHRFGVMQRSALRQKGFNPHVLVMTATPIPRTMALTLYGDLDLSTIDELPPGRQTVKTKCWEPHDRAKAYTFLHRQVRNGRQAFIVCPLVEESDTLEAKAATTEYERLSREVFPDLKLGLLHGQMHGSDKDRVMRSFRAGDFDILVSTSVVEVGIDVPRASVMLVEGAERFGLSQLHQFRGRVGRDREQGYCILIPERLSPEARGRLLLMERVHNGFALAEKDLEMRGPGEFFGTHQSGLPDLKLARLSDLDSLQLARQEAITLFERDPKLERDEHRLLRRQLNRVWPDSAEWS